jgi:hypothetical protein
MTRKDLLSLTDLELGLLATNVCRSADGSDFVMALMSPSFARLSLDDLKSAVLKIIDLHPRSAVRVDQPALESVDARMTDVMMVMRREMLTLAEFGQKTRSHIETMLPTCGVTLQCPECCTEARCAGPCVWLPEIGIIT